MFIFTNEPRLSVELLVMLVFIMLCFTIFCSLARRCFSCGPPLKAQRVCIAVVFLREFFRTDVDANDVAQLLPVNAVACEKNGDVIA
jgi:hypothetical protein